MMNEKEKKNGRSAIVIGGSIGGLLAARTLADYYDEVIIVERDQLPDEVAHRKGVPQSQHVHVLLASGMEIMQQMFPGIAQELHEKGAVQFDLARDAEIWLRGRWMKRFASNVYGTSSSRILLEAVIRERVRLLPNVRWLMGADVVGIITDEAGQRIEGVNLNWRGGVDGEKEIRADLIVDASGRQSKTPDWYESLGYERPEEIVVNAFLGYATRRYKKLAITPDWHLMFAFSDPPHNPRGGIIMKEEDGWVVTLGGYAREYPPTDEEGFVAFMDHLPVAFKEALEGSVADGGIAGYRRTENRWYRYDRLKKRPLGLLTFGDATCAFNPIYGQGMTISAFSSRLLGELFDKGLSVDEVVQQFPVRLSKIIEPAWLLATGEDFRWPTTEGGELDWITRFSHWYIDQMALASYGNEHMMRRFMEVQQMLKPTSALFGPRIVRDLIRYWLKRGRRGKEIGH